MKETGLFLNGYVPQAAQDIQAPCPIKAKIVGQISELYILYHKISRQL